MNLKDINRLSLVNLINHKSFLKRLTKSTATIFRTHHSRAICGSFLHGSYKMFHITDTTKERIKNVPTAEITGGKLIDLGENISKGVVFFNDGLHFLYSIKKNGVYLMSSRTKYNRISHDPSFEVGQTMSGFLYYDFFSDSSECYINNILDVIRDPDKERLRILAIDSSIHLPIIRKLHKEFEEKGYDGDIYKSQHIDYEKKLNDTRLCLQAFMFIHFAKVIDTTRISEDTRTFSQKRMGKPVTETEIIRVDTYYDETLNVINPFSVSGHYRNQPCGVGRKNTKLIYIDSFMKTGYTRIATKEKINLQNVT